MKLLALGVVVGVAVVSVTAAQSQTIRGVVLEDGTRRPIVGARVELVPLDTAFVHTAVTDSLGAFRMQPQRSGNYTVRLRHVAFLPVDHDTLLVRASETLELELRMARTAIPLEPVVVTTRRDRRTAEFYERRRTSQFGRFLTREEIERRPGAQASELLRGMAGVHLEPMRTYGNLITMRGGGTGRCLPTIYVDGMVVQQFAGSGIDDVVTSSALEGIEIYTSFATAPPPVHAHGACGVVAFWTRSGTSGRWSWRKLFVAGALVAGVFVITQVFGR